VALTAFNDRLYIAWTGTDSEHRLNVMSSLDGVSFGSKVILGDTSIAAPALAVFNGKLYIAWTGTDSLHRLNVMSSLDGVSFGNKVILGETSNAGPALDVRPVGTRADELTLAWTGTDARLNTLVTTNGRDFFNKVILGETSIAGPALAGFAGGRYIAWTGTDSDHHLNVSAR